MKDLTICRHFVQLVVFVLSNAKIFGCASTLIVVPYLHPSGAPFSTVIGIYDAIEYSASHGVFPLFVIGVVALTTVCFGKVFCGWACPVGMIQDLLSFLSGQRRKPSAEMTSQFRDLRYGIIGFSFLVAFIVGIRRNDETSASYLGAFTDAPFSVISPGSTIFAYIPWMFLWKHNVIDAAGYVGWLKIMLCVMLLGPAFYIPRFFCRFICPLGTIMDPLMPFRILKVSCNDSKKGNAILENICPTAAVVNKTSVSASCIHCGKCLVESPDIFQQYPY